MEFLVSIGIIMGLTLLADDKLDVYDGINVQTGDTVCLEKLAEDKFKIVKGCED